MSKFKILICSQQLASFRSGVGTYTFGLVRELANRGHRVTVVVPESEAMEIPGINTNSVPCPTFDPTPGGWLSLGNSFNRILRSEWKNHDLVHFTDAREAWRIKSSPIPITGMANDSYALDWLDENYPRNLFADRRSRSAYYYFLRWTEKRTYDRLDVLLANSGHVAKSVVSGYGIEKEHVTVINYGLPEWTVPEPLLLDGSPCILFVGGNFQRKGLPVLLEAASALKNHMPGLQLHVVGQDRNQPAMEKLASRLGLRDALEFHGWQPNERVRAMMAGADIFALPSLTEGFGMVYLEAMRVGTPVIATSIGGASEVFGDGEEALFVHPTDVDGLANAIEKIALNQKLANHLRKGGFDAVKRFTVEAMAEKTEHLFLEVLEKRSEGK
ncbi:MAG TPA: glycosyltransferase family 1 protein [Proteobacteria bacterium]|nr:glycosyltransferase family 1 protein [Pseudomonadota bacterium]